MWDSALYTKLINDTELIQYVSRTGDYPSIFSDSAPENVAFPYIIFTIAGTNGPDSAVDVFSVTIDHYDFQQSAKRSRLAIKRIIELLDREHLDHADYKTIRIYKSWSAAAPKSDEIDPRARHYIAKFTARAGRKGWIDNLIPGNVTLTSPINVTGSFVGSSTGAVTFLWVAADRAIDYDLEVTNIDTGEVTTTTITTTTDIITLTAAKLNPLYMTYAWRVRARSGLNYGSWSEQGTFRLTYTAL